ncbi:MAG: tol-pal system protein YbgF [Acidobacteriota bacterium]
MMMTRRAGILAVVVMLLAITHSASLEAANKEHQQMMADIRMLQQQTQQLQAQIVALTDVLKAVTTRLDDQAGVSRKSFADQKLLVDTVATEVRVVREKVDETNVRLTSMSQEVEAIRLGQAALAARTTQPAAPPGEAPPEGAQGAAPQPPPTPPPSPIAAGESPQRMFERARADYYAGQWSLAILGFDSYIKTFPKSDLADDAQYYIGETHYSAGKFKEAVAAYDALIANHPSSNTLPDTYYKRGLALNSLGQVPQAKASFEHCVKNYPDSDAGRLARQALDRLNRIGRQGA